MGVDLLRLCPEACFRLVTRAPADDVVAAASDGEYNDLQALPLTELPGL